jgi:thiamine kinase-like enzyme
LALPLIAGVTAPPPAGREKIEAVFVGHSGASLVLLRRNDRLFLRKMASHPAQNHRLRQQKDKQAFFAAAGVDTAQVLDFGFSGGLFYFDMAYIPALSLADQCSLGIAQAAPELASFVEFWLTRMQVTQNGEIGPALLVDKLHRVVAHCGENAALILLMPKIETIGKRLASLAWPALPRSLCHGDLTLDNILADDDGELFLIDFDVPDLSSYWLDLAKLYQDLAGHWCLRHLAVKANGMGRHHHAALALQQLQGGIDAVVDAVMPEFMPYMPLLVAMNLLRTLPYCREPAIAAYATAQIEALI